MKVAILSDIHGNMPALLTVLAHIDTWRPDHVIVNGDTVNRGPRPRQAWELIADRIRNRGWQHTMGNHEEYTLAWRDPDPDMSEADFLLYKTSLWTYQQFDTAQLNEIDALPRSVMITAPDGSQLVAAHASRHGTRDGMHPWTTNDKVRQKIAPFPPDVFVTSHTHRFFTRVVDDTLVVNSGAVGCPLDGYPRTGYAQLTWADKKWTAELIRLPYDRAETRRQYREEGFITQGGPTAYLLFKEWEHSRNHISIWGRTHRPYIESGDMTAWESIHAYLADFAAN